MNSRRRVLMVQPTGLSGVWHYTNALAGGLADAGFEVALATLLPFEDLGWHRAVRVWPIGKRRVYAAGSTVDRLRRPLDHADKMWRLRHIMRLYHPRIVHIHAPLGKLDFLYFRYLKSFGARVIYTAHDARHLVGEAGWFDWARYQAADGILVHSRRCREYLVEGGIDATKITPIAHGNYLSMCRDGGLSPRDARSLLGLPLDSRIILFFGAIAPYKGLDVLLEAFATLCRTDPNVRLVIAGEPLEDFGPYRRQIEVLGLADRILQDLRYLAFDEFARYFLAADLVALPYRRISQSGILQLAYGFGRPVVVSDVGGMGEAVFEDGTGIVLPKLGAQALATAIQRLLDDPEQARAIGARGRALAESKYSWRAVAREVAQVYG